MPDRAPHSEPVFFEEEEGPQSNPVRSAFVTLVELLEAGRASLLLSQIEAPGSPPIFTVAAAVGISPELIPTIRVPIGQGIAGLVAERGLSFFGRAPATLGLGSEYDTFLSVPIVTHQSDGEVAGVLNLTERMGGRRYTPADLAPVMSVARHIGQLLDFSRMALLDPVSGLPTRRAFDEALERELARSERTGLPFTVLFADLNGLKRINDTHGHAVGDSVIRAVGEALRQVIRPYDLACRYGGDEFVLLLSGSPDSHSSVEQRVQGAVGRASERLDLDFSLSLGSAHYPDDGKTAEELMTGADAHMYEHKRKR